jgi:hypothetical protein
MPSPEGVGRRRRTRPREGGCGHDGHRADLREERYGASSDQMLQVPAFRDADGSLVETDDLMAWSSLHCRYRALTDK